MASQSSDFNFHAVILGKWSEKERRWCASPLSSPASVESRCRSPSPQPSPLRLASPGPRSPPPLLVGPIVAPPSKETLSMQGGLLHKQRPNVSAMVAKAPISKLHLMTKEIMNMATKWFKYLPIWMIDMLVLLICYLVFGDTSKYGLRRPAIGPFSRKLQNNVYPVIDVGTYKKIKSGQIQVLPAMKSINGNVVEFADGRQFPFDAIVFATGYRSAAKKWLKCDDRLIGDDGMAQQRCPKGENGLYCSGMARRGIYGSCVDAEFIADDISKLQSLNDSGSGHE